MNRRGLNELLQLAATLREARLAELREAARMRRNTLDNLAALHPAPAQDAAPGAALAAHLRWRAKRKRELNMQLARETARWEELREEAVRAVGRHEALAELEGRAKPR